MDAGVELIAGVSGVLWPVYFVRCNQLYYVFCRHILSFTAVVLSPATILSDYAILSFVFILHGEMFSFVLYSDLNHGAELIISVRIC